MNKLLSFRPEPFESEFEFEDLPNGFGAQGESFEQEEEYESRRPGRSGRGSFRSSAVPRTRPKTGAKKPTKPPSWKGRPFPIIQPTFTTVVPVWPPVPLDGPGQGPSGGADQSSASDEGSDFVRWAQTCLNGYLGLRLPVHGVLDPNTRNAVRTFQERQGNWPRACRRDTAATGRTGAKRRT